jgi:branched-chain amino acid transport system permease protein
MESINLLIVLLIGGIGFIAGPLVGAMFNQLIPEALHVVSEYRMIVYGLITVLFIIYVPNGIVGLFHDKWRGRSQKKPTDAVAGIARR